MAYAGTMGHRRRHGSGLPGRLSGSRSASLARASPARRSPTCCGRAAGAIAPDAPSLPITVGGVAFNVPPAAIRFKVQRRPGAQARVDLSFVWPSLTPPDLSIKPLPTDTPDVTDRLFVTIAGERHHAVAGRAAEDDLSALRRRRADRRRRRAQPARLPRRLALPGRGSDLRAGRAGALPAPLHAPDRGDARRCACTSGASAAPTSRCAFRAPGWTIGGASPTASTG